MGEAWGGSDQMQMQRGKAPTDRGVLADGKKRLRASKGTQAMKHLEGKACQVVVSDAVPQQQCGGWSKGEG